MSLNLLPNQAKFQVDKIRAKLLGKKIVSYFLVIWIFIVLIVLAVLWGEKLWIAQLDKKYKLVVSEYLNLSQDIVTNQTIKFRTKLLAKVLGDRFEYANAFGIVGSIFDPLVKIKDFELKEKSFFVMSVIANSNEMMNKIETRIAEVNSGSLSDVKNITIKDVVYLKNIREWTVSMEVYLK